MSSFKDSKGVWLTLGLFGDKAGPYKKGIIFDTLDEARRKFIELEDPTGVLFADKYLGGYAHWKAVRASKGLCEDIEEWEEELEVRLRSKALIQIKNMSEVSFQASKLILDKGWDKKAGRPTKEAVEKEVRVQSKIKLAYANSAKGIKR